jgi:DNA-binding beta-propeller fold protein YncE
MSLLKYYPGSSLRQGFAIVFLLACLAFGPAAIAARIDKSDLNGDGFVDDQDLEIVATDYLEQDPSTVDWCVFRESSILNPKYFRRIMSDSIKHYQALLDYIDAAYGCDGVDPVGDLSDLNEDGTVDQDDLILFSTNYLETNWASVDWCVFHGAVLAGVDYDGKSTSYYLEHFVDLLDFINVHFVCGGTEPPSDNLALENTPIDIARFTAAPQAVGGFYVTDPAVGSLFVYDASLVPQAEIKDLNIPLGVAVDAQGRILVGNDGRNNIEVYDPSTGELLAVLGNGLLAMPNAITLDAAGNIYVTDSKKHNIKIFDSTYNLIKTIGRAGEGEDELYFPINSKVVVHSVDGVANVPELFVADNGNRRVQIFDLDGNWKRSITFDGTPGQGCNWAGVCDVYGLPPFTRVQALDVDSQGRLHVIDGFTASVMVFDAVSGEFLGSYGEEGTGPGYLKLPRDLLITSTDNPVVIAGDGGRIEIFTALQ